MDGITFDAEAFERLDGPGFEVRVWVERGGRVKIARFPFENQEDADDFAIAFRRAVRNGGDPYELLPGGGEVPS